MTSHSNIIRIFNQFCLVPIVVLKLTKIFLISYECLTFYFFFCRLERKYAIFSKLDACSFVANVYDDGNLVSIVTDCSPHATHVAGIAAAFHPDVCYLRVGFSFCEKCERCIDMFLHRNLC